MQIVRRLAPCPRIPLALVLALGAGALAQELVVDFARPLGPATHRACGFLHGISATSPDDSLLTPLKIRYVRGVPDSVVGLPALGDPATLKRLDRPNLRLAISFGPYSYTRKMKEYGEFKPAQEGDKVMWPGEGGNWAPWERFIGDQMKDLLDRKVDCHWIIWNEPDHKMFWPHDAERHRELWTRAYRKIRTVKPDAIITGPTTSNYSRDYLTTFLTFCKEHQCVPDMLTWHELTKTEKHVQANIEEMRVWCKEKDIPIKGIIIDEYGSKSGQFLPGTAVGFISAFEKAKVTYASRAIWTKTGTLCGGTTPDGKKPLAVWWTYKSYSDITGTLYDVAETADVRAIAGSDSQTSSIHLLIGNQSNESRPVTLVLQNLEKSGVNLTKAVVRRRLIPNSGETALESPEALADLSVEVANDGLKIDAGSLPAYSAIEVTIRKE